MNEGRSLPPLASLIITHIIYIKFPRLNHAALTVTFANTVSKRRVNSEERCRIAHRMYRYASSLESGERSLNLS
ncbi:hypothetical protein [Nostoc sp.]|uniref:hypothetical protein n=1 Tax=Nostoc sp. TaxID=1180 RepID=UPI002FF4EEFA